MGPHVPFPKVNRMPPGPAALHLQAIQPAIQLWVGAKQSRKELNLLKAHLSSTSRLFPGHKHHPEEGYSPYPTPKGPSPLSPSSAPCITSLFCFNILLAACFLPSLLSCSISSS